MKYRKSILIFVIVCLAATCIAIFGCGKNNSTNSDSEYATSVDIANMNLQYKDNDKDASYDANKATKINLADEQTSIDGAGAKYSDKTITISNSGTFIASGTLNDGQIYIDVDSKYNVQLVLDGASIINTTGPAIYAKSADKVVLTLAENSQNKLIDT
ncbi:MAG: carbohydrate-binding domain-containing protein, partial [Coriobacteriales bacterium]|nr:carbohydrate-binding domain-containing protein [Coriobacteriales bacterium]